MTRDAQDSPPRACEGCEIGRRDFLRRAAVTAVGLAIAATGSAAAADLPVRWLAGDPRNGTEKAYPIPARDEVTIDRDSEVILVRHAGHVFAFALSCPHQNTALRWQEGAGIFECPKHHSKYQPDGTFISGRATRAMDRLPIRRDGDRVLVDVDRALQQDTELGAWTAAVVAL
jgi:nitrite reductase/ring-hydroxylating ferredoxin subunit